MVDDSNIRSVKIEKPEELLQRGGRSWSGEYFLLGPVAMRWLRQAGSLSGKSLHVAVELAHLVGLKGSDSVRFNLSRQEGMAVKRDAASRALNALEKAKLIKVDRKPGRCPVVTVINMRPTKGRSNAAIDSDE